MVHRRDVLPELGVHASMHGTYMEQAIRTPEIHLLSYRLVLVRAYLQATQAEDSLTEHNCGVTQVMEGKSH